MNPDDTASAVTPQDSLSTIPRLTAQELLAQCYAAGVRVRVLSEDTLHVSGHQPHPELSEAIRVHKWDLLDFLRDAEPVEDPVPDYDPDDFDLADVLNKSASIMAPYQKAIGVIMHDLTRSFVNQGASHGDGLAAIGEGYGVCPAEMWQAAQVLSERCVIELREDTSSGHDCACDSCRARRTWVQFPFDLSIDHDLLKEERQREYQRRLAIARAQRISNEKRNVRQLRSGEGIVYLMRSGPRHKIGITTNLNRRIEQLKAQAPFPLEVVHTASGKRYAQMESQLHRAYQSCRVHGEWFELSPDQVAAVIESMNDWAAKGGD